MNPAKLCGLLGMCRRSGRLVTGFDAVVALKGERGALLMTAADASQRTVKELLFRADAVPVYRLPLSKDEVARAIGSQKPVAVLATADEGFAKALLPLSTLISKEESHYDD